MRKELFFRFMFIVPSFMVIRKKLSFFVLAFLCMTVLVAQPTLKIDYSRPGPEIPKSMYGIFLKRSTIPAMVLCMQNLSGIEDLKNMFLFPVVNIRQGLFMHLNLPII